MFTHLHLHTEYSALDSIIRIKDLVRYLKDNGFTSCAITDHGSMAGCLKFYQEMKKENLNPLIGIEAYVTHQPDNTEKSLLQKDNYHLVLIAKNNKGYKQLLKLSSESSLRNFYYKPRIYINKLREVAEDCFAFSACLAGEMFQQGFKNNCMPEILAQYRSIFENNFLGEIQDWSNPEQIMYNKALIKLATENNLKLVLTSDAHFLRKEDYNLHELVIAMQLKKTLQQYREEGKMIYGEEFYVRKPEEMLYSAKSLDIPESYYNTNWISEQCSVEITTGKFYPPRYLSK